MNGTARGSTNASLRTNALAGCFVVIVAAGGCDFSAPGNGNGDPPGLGCYDLDPSHVFIDYDLDSPFVGEEVLYDGDAFLFKWNVCYHKGGDQEFLSSDPFITRIEVFKDDEVFWEYDMDSESISTLTCRDEEMFMEEGLPPGQYKVVVTCDATDIVHECQDLAYTFNNTVEKDFNVEAIPIDDFAEAPADNGDGSVDDGPDGLTGLDDSGDNSPTDDLADPSDSADSDDAATNGLDDAATDGLPDVDTQGTDDAETNGFPLPGGDVDADGTVDPDANTDGRRDPDVDTDGSVDPGGPGGFTGRGGLWAAGG